MLNRKEIARLANDRLDNLVTKSQADQFVETVFKVISDALEAGETVSIARFGQFSKRARKARMARNPGSGQPIPVPAHFSPAFKASAVMKKAVK